MERWFGVVTRHTSLHSIRYQTAIRHVKKYAADNARPQATDRLDATVRVFNTDRDPRETRAAGRQTLRESVFDVASTCPLDPCLVTIQPQTTVIFNLYTRKYLASSK